MAVAIEGASRSTDEDYVCEALMIQALGEGPWLIHLKLLEECVTREEVLDGLDFFFELLEDPGVVVLTANSFYEVSRLGESQGRQSGFLENGIRWRSCFNMEPCVRFNKESGLYREEALALVGREVNLSTIGVLTSGYDHLSPSVTEFLRGCIERRRQVRRRERRNLSRMGVLDMRELFPEQRLCGYLHTAVILHLLLDTVQCAIQTAELEADEMDDLSNALKNLMARLYVGNSSYVRTEYSQTNEVVLKLLGPKQQRRPVNAIECQALFRKAAEMEPHPLDKEKSRYRLIVRYRMEDFRVRTHRLGLLRNPNDVRNNHLVPFPVLCEKTLCSSCGGRHFTQSLECPIVQYQLGLPITDARLFRVFPCLVCDNLLHTTTMCPTLHGFCEVCRERGHTQLIRCQANREKWMEKRHRYLQFRGFGYLTRTAGRDDHHPWGQYPDQARCVPNELPEVEWEDDELFNLPGDFERLAFKEASHQ